VKKQNPARNIDKTTKESKLSDWDQLRERIVEYAEAYVADSWKGGGDPSDYREIELALQLETEKLNNHIRRMEEKYS
jgi:hypothetical protein